MKDRIEILKKAIHKTAESIGRQLNLMEVCGTHTVAIFRSGIRSLLPEGINLLSGPGCPVCVTPEHDIDWAVEFSTSGHGVILTFGDMMRVPGTKASLYDARSMGADVRVVYSPMDCLSIAKAEPEKTFVFMATGFETTSPLIGATIIEAKNQGVENLFFYSSHKLVPPALRALVVDPEVKIHGFILPGHVSTIIGSRPYEFVASEYGIPSVITGFEGVDILEGILMLLKQIKEERATVEIQYKKAVRPEGNPRALEVLGEVFQEVDAQWRGIGTIPQSGLEIKDNYSMFNAKVLYEVSSGRTEKRTACRCGDVLKGKILPTGCPLFAKACTPEHPVGACMVSTEGSCAAYYKYGR
ncbi:MAG: hydrogenase formation protein HypD [Nitrospirae bacterium]|nr:MAG: hydrogenase formation protein HypD [Nitrospirota bacterium]